MPLDAIRVVLLRDLDAAVREVEAYTSDDALWRIVPGTSNAGGTLARHLAGNLRHFVGSVLGGTDFVRDRDAEFSGKALSRAEVAAELRAAAADVDASLRALDAEAFAKPYPRQVGGQTLRTDRFLVHLAAHLGYHLGQLDYHRRMQQPDAQPIGTMAVDALA